MIKRKTIFRLLPLIILGWLGCAQNLYAQQVSGSVTDANSGETIPGANILVKGTSTGTSTDSEGNFELTVSSMQDTLVISFVGYQTQKVPINGRAEINITMQSQAISGEEMVVVGYGTSKRKDLTGSIGSVTADELEKEPTTSFDEALQGKMAGVNVVQSNGAPGGRTRIRIRGQNSVLGGGDPLYVIDGVPITSGSSGNTNILASINSDDIQSIDILKDASATAIYGARGSNGVILITTKEGSQGHQQINFKSSFGFSKVSNKLNLMNTEQFVDIANEQARNDGNPEPFPDLNAVPKVNTDWFDEIFRTALTQNYNLSFSGGDDDTRYNISGNYHDEEGTIIGSDFGRGSLRLNFDQDISPRFKVTPHLFLSRNTSNRINTEGQNGAGVIVDAYTAPPFLKPRDKNGNFTSFSKFSKFPFSPGDVENPVAAALAPLNKLKTDRIIGNVSAQYELLESLSLKVSGGVDNVDNEIDSYTPRVLQAGQPSGAGSEAKNSTTTYLNENTLTYKNDFGQDHRINATAGFTWQQQKTNNLSASARGFISDELLNNDLSAGEDFSAPHTGVSEWTLVSWLGRVNYVFKDRYLFTVTTRVDGSSRFGAGHKYGTFPSGAFAWRISDENFIKHIDQISNLKLRLSWGITGNQAINPYQSLQKMQSAPLVLGGGQTVGFVPANLGNPDLKWETTNQTDIGLDLGLWNQRFRLTADYYHKKTTDLLALVNLPPTSGFTSILRNIGSMENKGFEVAANVNVLTGDFLWDISANLSANRNKITKLARSSDIIAPRATIVGPSNIVREGEPLSSFYGLEQDGLTNDGLFNYVDQNGDGDINSKDRVILGNPYPDFTYGFTTNFSYKGFSLSAFIQGVEGKDLWNANKSKIAFSFQKGYNQLADVVNRWTPENPSQNAPYPKATTDLNIEPSSVFVEDASYLRLKNVRLGYDLPVSRMGLPLRSLKVYVSGQNLVTLTDYSGFSPDVNSYPSGDLRVGVDYQSYPNSKSVTFGMQIGI